MRSPVNTCWVPATTPPALASRLSHFEGSSIFGCRVNVPPNASRTFSCAVATASRTAMPESAAVAITSRIRNSVSVLPRLRATYSTARFANDMPASFLIALHVASQ